MSTKIGYILPKRAPKLWWNCRDKFWRKPRTYDEMTDCDRCEYRFQCYTHSKGKLYDMDDTYVWVTLDYAQQEVECYVDNCMY